MNVKDADGVTETPDWLHTLQLNVPAVGHASIISPPLDPHPVIPAEEEDGVITKTELVVTLGMEIVAAVVQLLAPIAVVPTVNW